MPPSQVWTTTGTVPAIVQTSHNATESTWLGTRCGAASQTCLNGVLASISVCGSSERVMRTSGRKAGQAGLLCGVVLFQVALAAPLAWGAEAGSAAAAAPGMAKEGGPFGGCEPIGLTASGELVFPLECKKLIKKPADAPVAGDDRAAAEDRTASTDAKPAAPAAADTAAVPETSSANQAAAGLASPAAEPKPAMVVDKPETRKAAVTDPSAAGRSAKTKGGMTKQGTINPPSAKSASDKSAVAKSAMTSGIAGPAKTAAASAATRPSSAKTPAAKTVAVAAKEPSSKEPALKDSAPKDSAKSGQGEVPKAASKPTAMAAIKSMIVMAKPANTGTPAARPQSDDRPRLRTANMPGCMQFRSYNAATRSYRGFDGHIYACR
ncbi:hypothetical protein BRADO3011 [Bradyrhizobium sp. ORS 278]|nr:hypothetical protein BRADO3011 [Bradyrhizobium sp. ORS 278]